METIEMLKPSAIKKYKRNAKQHPEQQINVLMKSIQEFGFTNPILIDSKNEIIAGHGRYEAALRLGLEEIRCIRATHLTPEQVIAYRLADNKIAEMGEINKSFELQDLEFLKLSSFDLTIAGYDLALTPALETEAEGDDAPANAEKPSRTTKKLKRCPRCGVLL